MYSSIFSDFLFKFYVPVGRKLVRVLFELAFLSWQKNSWQKTSWHEVGTKLAQGWQKLAIFVPTEIWEMPTRANYFFANLVGTSVVIDVYANLCQLKIVGILEILVGTKVGTKKLAKNLKVGKSWHFLGWHF